MAQPLGDNTPFTLLSSPGEELTILRNLAVSLLNLGRVREQHREGLGLVFSDAQCGGTDPHSIRYILRQQQGEHRVAQEGRVAHSVKPVRLTHQRHHLFTQHSMKTRLFQITSPLSLLTVSLDHSLDPLPVSHMKIRLFHITSPLSSTQSH